jgi:hypothetical protein
MEDKILEKYEKMLVDNGIINEATTLTRKHFTVLAGMIKNSTDLNTLKELLVDWAGTLNPQFDVQKFRQAAGLKETGRK